MQSIPKNGRKYPNMPGIIVDKSTKRCSRQLRETESTIFQSGFSHLQMDCLKENLNFPAALVKRFCKHFVHMFQRVLQYHKLRHLGIQFQRIEEHGYSNE